LNGAEEEMMRLVLLPVLILAATLLPGSADAGLFGLGGHAGYFEVSDDGEKTFFGGAHARLRLPLFIAIEGALDYRPSATRTVIYPSPGTEVDVTTYPMTLSALAYPTPMIYVLAGVGWYNTTIEIKDSGLITGITSETNDNFGSHLGAGLELPVGGNKSVFADIRYVFLDYDTTKLDLGDVDELDADYYAIQAGLTFEF
jgi:hypothetical protein